MDLATYGSAGELVRRGFPFARYVQYAILFDRILRFPITGRPRAQLRRPRRSAAVRLPAPARRAALDGQPAHHRLGAARRRRWRTLRGASRTLYAAGIDMSKVSYWAAAHDLVARVRAAQRRLAVAREARVVSDEAEPRAWIDRVLDDEFPLSTFYLSLQKKLADRAAADREPGACLRDRLASVVWCSSPATTTRACTPRSSRPSPRPTAALRPPTATTTGRPGAAGSGCGRSSATSTRSRSSTAPAATSPALATVMQSFRGRHLRRDRAHQRGRVRRARALRRLQARRPADRRRQADAGARAAAPSSASATSTTCRRGWSRSRRRPSSARSTRRPRPPLWPRRRTPPACCCTSTAPGSPTPPRRPGHRTCARSPPTAAWTFSPSAAPRTGCSAARRSSSCRRDLAERVRLRAQAGDAAGLQDALRLGAAPAPSRRTTSGARPPGTPTPWRGGWPRLRPRSAGVRLAYPVQANAVFVALPAAVTERLLEDAIVSTSWDEAGGRRALDVLVADDGPTTSTGSSPALRPQPSSRGMTAARSAARAWPAYATIATSWRRRSASMRPGRRACRATPT